MSDVRLMLGDCLLRMTEVETASVDCLVTDPPYGIGKADWDATFPTAWFSEALRVVKPDGAFILLTNGGDALRDAINLLGPLYRAVFPAWLSNGMTRGPVSFSNWVAVTFGTAAPKWRPVQDVIRVIVRPCERVEGHPSPKPLNLMVSVLERLTDAGDTILDPFAGSGSTGVACVKTGRAFIGIERDEAYFSLARQRIADAALQQRMTFEEAA